MTKRVLVFIFGLTAYVMFLASFVYAIGFIGNIGVPQAIDGVPVLPTLTAVLNNLGLLAIFSVQHSLMARPFFKRWLTNWIPEAAERSVYVLSSSLALFLLFWAWQPLGGLIWEVHSETGQLISYVIFAAGWLTVLGSTFAINHFDLFGLRQIWLYSRGINYTPLAFKIPLPYKFVRHPLYVGWLLAFWATPTMTVSHLLFSVATTLYILLAIKFEEKDLSTQFGQEYELYRKSVPMIIPRLSTKPSRSTCET